MISDDFRWPRMIPDDLRWSSDDPRQDNLRWPKMIFNLQGFKDEHFRPDKVIRSQLLSPNIATMKILHLKKSIMFSCWKIWGLKLKICQVEGFDAIFFGGLEVLIFEALRIEHFVAGSSSLNILLLEIRQVGNVDLSNLKGWTFWGWTCLRLSILIFKTFGLQRSKVETSKYQTKIFHMTNLQHQPSQSWRFPRSKFSTWTRNLCRAKFLDQNSFD